MIEAVEAFRKQIVRRAIIMEIGGFRPSDDPAASWFGRVGLALPGEAWPHTGNKPLAALCQINLTQLPFRPPRLDDLDFITVFVDPDELPSEDANGTNWCLRAYRSVGDLVPLAAVQTDATIKPFPMRCTITEIDYPSWEDVPGDIPPEVDEEYSELFPNNPGLKLGGWPSLIQSEIYWAPSNRHPISPEYVFQIDTTEKGNWMWGDNGVGYFGRGTVSGHEDEWAIEWQCF